jgi:hypothetical protein
MYGIHLRFIVALNDGHMSRAEYQFAKLILSALKLKSESFILLLKVKVVDNRYGINEEKITRN